MIDCATRTVMVAVTMLWLGGAPVAAQPLPPGHPSVGREPMAAQPATAPATTATPTPATMSSGGRLTEGERISITDQQITLDGHVLRYRATAGDLVLKDEGGRARANFFFVAYEKYGEDQRTRPVTFVFNGGPGAAAVWLHLGTAGPVRIDLGPAGEAPAPPYRLVTNEATWLDVTDLVFIDPVGTGYSRAASGQQPQEFFNVERDISSVADFIRLYTTRYQRWLSPKLLAGESYGATRAAGLSRYLHDQQGIDLNGIILISSVLDFATIQTGQGNDLPYALYVPSYTAAAWYHKRLADDLQRQDLPTLLAEAQQWSLGEYRAALSAGATLPAAQRQTIVQRLARYTGLSEQLIDKADLRVDPGVFEAMLLNDQRLLVGRFDARVTGPNASPLSPYPEYDPSLAPYLGAYTATMSDYARRQLKYQSDLSYEVLTGKVQPWNFGRSGMGYLYVGDDLRATMVRSPHLRVLFASGYYDLATPYLSQRYTVDHLDLPAALRGNITHTYYPSGHMMYHQPDGRRKLKEDVAAFIAAAVRRGQQ